MLSQPCDSSASLLLGCLFIKKFLVCFKIWTNTTSNCIPMKNFWPSHSHLQFSVILSLQGNSRWFWLAGFSLSFFKEIYSSCDELTLALVLVSGLRTFLLAYNKSPWGFSLTCLLSSHALSQSLLLFFILFWGSIWGSLSASPYFCFHFTTLLHSILFSGHI